MADNLGLVIQVNYKASQKNIDDAIDNLQKHINEKKTLHIAFDSASIKGLDQISKAISPSINQVNSLNSSFKDLGNTVNNLNKESKINFFSGGKLTQTKEIKEMSDALGKLHKITTTFSEGTETHRIVEDTTNYKKQREEVDKLANSMAKLREKSEIRIKTDANKSDLAQNTAINKQVEKENLDKIKAQQNASDLARRLIVEEETRRISTTTESQKNIERIILGSNEIISEQQKRINSINANNYEQVWLKAIRQVENAMGKVNEQSQMRVANQNNKSNLSQNTAVNKAIDDAYVKSQREEKARLKTQEETSNTTRRLIAEEERQRISTTTETQRKIEQQILKSNETIADQQKRINSVNANNYEQVWLKAFQRVETEEIKLANMMGRMNEQSQIRVSAQNNRSNLVQNTAINNAQNSAYVQAQRDEQARLRARQEANDTARRMIAEEERQRVSVTTDAQRHIEQAILGSNETIAQQQARMNSVNGANYEQVWHRAIENRRIEEERLAQRQQEQAERNIQRQQQLYAGLFNQTERLRQQQASQLNTRMQSSLGLGTSISNNLTPESSRVLEHQLQRYQNIIRQFQANNEIGINIRPEQLTQLQNLENRIRRFYETVRAGQRDSRGFNFTQYEEFTRLNPAITNATHAQQYYNTSLLEGHRLIAANIQETQQYIRVTQQLRNGSQHLNLGVYIDRATGQMYQFNEALRDGMTRSWGLGEAMSTAATKVINASYVQKCA